MHLSHLPHFIQTAPGGYQIARGSEKLRNTHAADGQTECGRKRTGRAQLRDAGKINCVFQASQDDNLNPFRFMRKFTYEPHRIAKQPGHLSLFSDKSGVKVQPLFVHSSFFPPIFFFFLQLFGQPRWVLAFVLTASSGCEI